MINPEPLGSLEVTIRIRLRGREVLRGQNSIKHILKFRMTRVDSLHLGLVRACHHRSLHSFLMKTSQKMLKSINIHILHLLFKTIQPFCQQRSDISQRSGKPSIIYLYECLTFNLVFQSWVFRMEFTTLFAPKNSILRFRVEYDTIQVKQSSLYFSHLFHSGCKGYANQATSKIKCDPVGIRTRDPQLRRLLLYPAELPDPTLRLQRYKKKCEHTNVYSILFCTFAIHYDRDYFP